MNSYNFLPMWYRNKIDKRNSIKLKLYLVIMIFNVIICLTRFFTYKAEAAKLDNEINKIISKTNSKKIKTQTRDKEKVKTINTYKNVSKNITSENSDYKFHSITIEEAKVSIESEAMDVYKAISFIDNIENNKDYKVKNIDMENIEDNKVKIKMIIEVKSNE